MRMWSWEVDENVVYYKPTLWVRTGPGTATDGKPKFDLQAIRSAQNPAIGAEAKGEIINRSLTRSPMRSLGIILFAALGAALFTSSASALRFTDESYFVPKGVVGKPYLHVFELAKSGGSPPYHYHP